MAKTSRCISIGFATLAAGTLVLASGCNSRTPTSVVSPGWYNSNGQQCSAGNPSPGCHMIQTVNTDKDGNVTYSYAEIDYKNDPGYNGAALQGQLQTGTLQTVNDQGQSVTFIGTYWVSPSTGIAYGFNGTYTIPGVTTYTVTQATPLNSLGGGEYSRDLISDAAADETHAVENAGNAYAAKYGVSENQGIEIAKALTDYQKMATKGSRTEADFEDYKRSHGIDLRDAQNALASLNSTGDVKPLMEVNSNVAAIWNISPETSARIIQDALRTGN